jgi:putative alpha-1,2-mannosidase
MPCRVRQNACHANDSAAGKVLVEGKALEASFDFGMLQGSPLLVQLAVSGVSEDGAPANLGRTSWPAASRC